MDTNKLNQIITDISVNIGFTSCNYTVKQKMMMCQAFADILSTLPEEMSKYLIYGARGSSLQNKIFKRYVEIFEKSLPFIYIKGGKKYTVESLLDPSMGVFVSEQSFIQEVNEQLKIKNNTQEMYIGGRKASCVRPYYIGKLLSVGRIDNGKDLMSKVEDYTFAYIKMKNVKPGLKVKVTHLGSAPHYQMGPMVYLNRIKKEIQNRIKND